MSYVCPELSNLYLVASTTVFLSASEMFSSQVTLLISFNICYHLEEQVQQLLDSKIKFLEKLSS